MNTVAIEIIAGGESNGLAEDTFQVGAVLRETLSAAGRSGAYIRDKMFLR